jgi:tripartite-type tricarboxylate transporter receptor subunit TctC
MRLISYKGSAPAITDVIGYQVPILVDNLTPALPHVKSGRIRAIAVTSQSRLATLPDVPTVAESGYPGFGVEGWVGIVAPAKTPHAVVTLLNREIRAVLAMPEVKSKFDQVNVSVRSSTPEEFAAFIRTETDFWGKVIRRIGLTAN